MGGMGCAGEAPVALPADTALATAMRCSGSNFMSTTLYSDIDSSS